LRRGAHLFEPETDLWARVMAAHKAEPVNCVLIDEAQFLTKEQVWQCARLADEAGIPELCYGLRTDFQGELFPGSAALLGIADSLTELKAICHCGRKSSMNLRVDASGAAVKQGAQTEIGGNDRYLALCRKHFTEALAG
jgi:thymidine kinase